MARTEEFKVPFPMRVSWAKDLLALRTMEDGKEKYGATLIVPKTTDISILKKMAGEAALAEWGDKAKQWFVDGLIKSPILDGDGKQGMDGKTGERRPEMAGCWFIRVSANKDHKPFVFDKKLQLITALGADLYSGCHANARLNAYTWDNAKSGKGVSFGVTAIQALGYGDPIAGGGTPDPSKFFETIADEGAEAIAAAKKGQDGAAALFS